MKKENFLKLTTLLLERVVILSSRALPPDFSPPQARLFSHALPFARHCTRYPVRIIR